MAIYSTRPSDIEGPLQMEQEKSDKTPEYHEDAALGRPCASAPPQRQACSGTLIVGGTQAASNRAQNVMVQYSAWWSTATDTSLAPSFPFGMTLCLSRFPFCTLSSNAGRIYLLSTMDRFAGSPCAWAPLV